MAAKQTKTRKKPMTLDAFAILIQKDLARMATKDGLTTIREESKADIRQLRAEMGIGFRNLDADLKMLTDAVVSKADLANTHSRSLPIHGKSPTSNIA